MKSSDQLKTAPGRKEKEKKRKETYHQKKKEENEINQRIVIRFLPFEIVEPIRNESRRKSLKSGPLFPNC